MTALEKYARLEGPGVWRAGPEAQRRDVSVALGEASLVICDARSGAALSHWALPAVQRLNRGSRPALYAPNNDAGDESLELDDPLLIEALEVIRAALGPKQPTRLVRLAAVGAIVAGVVLVALWLPGSIVERTAALIPPAGRAEIGRAALDLMFAGAAPASATSPPAERVCADPEGRQAMATLRNRVLGSDWRVVVVTGVPGVEAAHLAGQVVVVSEALVTRLDSPEALAGWLAAEALASSTHDPLLDALSWAGTRATLSLLTTGTLPEGALRGYARNRITQPPVLPDAGQLAGWLGNRGIPLQPYAMSLPANRVALTQALQELNAAAPPRSSAPILSDGEWLTVQAICANS